VRPGEYEGELRTRFWMVARRCDCVVCGTQGRNFYVEAHHIVYQQELRRQLSAIKGTDAYAELMWDVRNMLPLCRLCHARHHNARRRVTTQELKQHAPRAWQFAANVGCGWFIGRNYVLNTG
jgi:hypothetical protein